MRSEDIGYFDATIGISFNVAVKSESESETDNYFNKPLNKRRI